MREPLFGRVCAFLLIVVLIFTRSAPALDPQKDITQYVHLVWQQDSGLPPDFKGIFTQTREGYIWLATSAGPVRFDGVRFKLFSLRDEAGISSNSVFALAAGHDGSLWIGTADGLVQYEGGIFKSYGRQYGLAGEAVFALAEGEDGNLWVGTPSGLVRLKGKEFQRYTNKEGLPSNDIRKISVDQAGDVWVGTAAGASHYHNGKFVTYTVRDAGSSFPTILRDDAGQVWAGTSAGLSRFENGQFNPVGDALGRVEVIAEDRDGTLWIGASTALIRYNKGQFSTYTGYQEVRSILEDHEGGLWVGTVSGTLHRFSEGSITHLSSLEGLANDQTWSITQDGRGDFWIGTDRGLSRYRNGKFQNYSRRDGLRSDRVLSTFADHEGNVWIGTPTGLCLFRDGRFFHYGSRQGISNDFVLAIYEDREGDLWVTSGSRLHQLRKGKVIRTYGVADGLSYSHLRAIAEDLEGNLWIGSNGDGVFRLSHGRFTHYTVASGLPSNVVLTIYPDQTGAVWIGTDGSGIARHKDGRFTLYNSSTGLYDDTANQILEDDSRHLWVASDKGIYRVEKAELNDFAEGQRTFIRSVAYGTAEGMRSAVTNGGIQPAGCKARDGSLWFPTTGGVAVVNPRNVQKNTQAPPVIIEEVNANTRWLNPHTSFRVSPGEGRLEFHYTAFNYNSPHKIMFRYQLEGFDKSWTEAGERRAAYYTNIPPGRYTFRVSAANPDGVWNQAGVGVELELEPHFYQTYWFLGTGIVGAFFFAAGAYRLRIRRVRARERELEQLVNQATRELQERKRVEAELRRSEDKFAKAFHSSPAAMSISSLATGSIIDVNDRFLTLFGFRLEEVIGHTVAELKIWEDLSQREQVVASLRQLRPVRNWETRFQSKPGKNFYVLFSAEIVNFGGEECLLAVALDITEQKQLEDRLRQSQKMEAVGKLAGGVAHDFNNLLTVIKGYSRLVVDRLADQELRIHVERIDTAADRAASLTTQLLAFSRGQVLQPRVFNLNSLLLDLDKMLRRLIAENIEIVTVTAPDLGSVQADPGQIEQVIMNLVVNARDAMPNGGKLTLETSNVELDENYAVQHAGARPGKYVMLAVSDTGSGMDEKVQARIFEPFFTTKETGKGTGLGLSMVYGIVKQSGGNIWVYSEPGRGTTFKVYLPRVEAPAEATLGEQQLPASVRGNETILLVEDDKAVRELARTVLTACGYSVLVADSALAASSLCEHHSDPIDLLLTDVVMPGISGRELACQVQASRPGLKVLFMSGYTTNAIVHRGELDRNTSFLPKPFTPDSLTRKVREVLDDTMLRKC